MSEPLSVTLTMDETMVNALRADQVIALELDSYVIDSKPMADLANTAMRGSIARIAEIKEWKAKFVEPAKQIIANAEALFDPAIAARQQFVAGMRGKLADYTTEQLRIAAEEQRKRDEEARRVRQEAEQRAAAERAKAEAIALEQRRLAAEAEAARQKAEAEGNAKEAAKQAAAAATLTEKAHATIENAETKASQVVMAAEAAATATPITMPEKVSGFGMRDNWKLRLVAGKSEQDAIAMIVAAIAGVPVDKFVRPELLAMFKLDASAGDRLAKALKKACNVPGMQSVNEQTTVSRAA